MYVSNMSDCQTPDLQLQDSVRIGHHQNLLGPKLADAFDLAILV